MRVAISCWPTERLSYCVKRNNQNLVWNDMEREVKSNLVASYAQVYRRTEIITLCQHFVGMSEFTKTYAIFSAGMIDLSMSHVFF